MSQMFAFHCACRRINNHSSYNNFIYFLTRPPWPQNNPKSDRRIRNINDAWVPEAIRKLSGRFPGSRPKNRHIKTAWVSEAIWKLSGRFPGSGPGPVNFQGGGFLNASVGAHSCPAVYHNRPVGDHECPLAACRGPSDVPQLGRWLQVTPADRQRATARVARLSLQSTNVQLASTPVPRCTTTVVSETTNVLSPTTIVHPM